MLPIKEETTVLYVKGVTKKNKAWLSKLIKQNQLTYAEIINHWIEEKRRKHVKRSRKRA